ncbi:hypothetical protein KI387_034558, partial [Taxus chinensis]
RSRSVNHCSSASVPILVECRTSLSRKGEELCHRIEKGIAHLFKTNGSEEYRKAIDDHPSKETPKISLVHLLNKFLPEYKDVYKYLACMDFGQLLRGEESSVHVSAGQSLGAVPRVLTVNFNAGKYRGSNEVWAGLAIEITREIEGSMTNAQLLSTRWRNTWIMHSGDIYFKFMLPCLLLVGIGWAAWIFLDRLGPTELKDLKYGSIPVTIIATVWSALGALISFFKPVSTQISGYFSKLDYSQQLGYQQKVIDDITFLKAQIGCKPCFIFSLISGEKWNNWWGLRKETIGETRVPKYGSAPQRKLRIVSFVDDLDHCEDEATLK